MTWPPAGIKWAYADEFTALAHGDTFLLTPQIRAAVKFDHVITDPPYSENTHKNAQTNADKAQGKKLMTFDSITVEKLREFFEVNRYFVTVAALKALADEGSIDAAVVAKAVAKYGIDPNKPNPVTV